VDSSSSAAGKLDHPTGLAVDDSRVYVNDSYNHRVQEFTLAGAYSRNGARRAELSAAGLAHGIATDGAAGLCGGHGECVGKQVELHGHVLTKWGTKSNAGSLYRPAGIARDASNTSMWATTTPPGPCRSSAPPGPISRPS